jgi:hypothetical protein
VNGFKYDTAFIPTTTICLEMVLSTLEISFLTKTFKGAFYLSKFYFHMMFPLSEDIAITDPGFVLTINTLLNPNSSNKV